MGVDPVVGAASAAAMATKKKLDTPKGKFWLAKIADIWDTDPAKAKTLMKGAAKGLGVSVEEVGNALRKRGISTGAAAIKSNVQGE